MNELVLPRHIQTVKWHLLASASAIALLAATAPSASADEDNHYSIELGSSYGMQAGGSTGWFLPFAAPGAPTGGDGEGEGDGDDTAARIHSPFGPPGAILPISPRHSWDFEGAIKLQPADGDLIYSLGIKFGRSARRDASAAFSSQTEFDYTNIYSGAASHRESHLNVDFQVGKDFGLGMFGHDGTSVFSAGLRYAHFTARTDTGFYTSTKYFAGSGGTLTQRSFVGVGPMISWEASAPISEMEGGGISLDWGINAAVLFGKQKARGLLVYDDGYALETSRSHNVTVPEVGGFAGLSYHPADSGLKVSFGYKVDAAFNALDAGVFERIQVDRIQHGPFVKIGFQN
ncbi:MAG TPA: hypothetical protein VGM36_05510 [Rhizomicrobium sp.]